MDILNHFHDSWFKHPEWWFCPNNSHDAYIIEAFQDILDIPFPNVPQTSLSTNIALIIAYDQLPRHIFRNQPCKHIILHFLNKSLELLKYIQLEEVHGEELCFILLPLRHTNNPTDIFKVLNIMWGRIVRTTTQPHLTKIYQRFIKATYERCPISFGTFFLSPLLNKEIPREILDFHSETISTFDPKHPLVSIFLKHLTNTTPYIISLSGGLDSMVCSYIAASILHIKPVFLHINYNNRETSSDEELFVRDWSNKLNIPLYIRKFDEINRPLCMKYELRDTYETYTRNVRYACYKDAMTDTRVILGHNKDDCCENFLTNVTKCTKYENLLGMEHISIVDGITFYRPFLDIPKSQLMEYAQAQGISYLYDSTPKWSQRGKIRDNVVPALNEWDRGCIPGFFSLATHVKGLHNILDQYVDTFLQDLHQEDDGGKIKIYLRNIKSPPNQIEVWRKLFQKLSLPQPTTKAIDCLIARLNSHTRTKTNTLTNTNMNTKTNTRIKVHLSKMLEIDIIPSTIIITNSS